MNIVNRNLYITVICFIVFFMVFTLSLFGGRYVLEPHKVIYILWAGLTGELPNNVDYSVIWNLRLPRVLLNCLVGMGLALSGAVFQGIFRNPLVSPDVLGVSTGAALGACLGILMSYNEYMTSIIALSCGILSVWLTYNLSKLRGESTTLTLVLAGMIISAVGSALISLIKYVADPYDKLPAITYWLMGSFSSASYQNLLIIGMPIIIGCVILLLMRWRINILSLSEDEILALGVNPKKTRKVVIVLATFITAACVTATGVIGWVGLVIPHICRMIIGVNHSKLLPLSCLIGATFMILLDFLARTVSAAEIPIGILTALVGAPFFAFLFKHLKGGL